MAGSSFALNVPFLLFAPGFIDFIVAPSMEVCGDLLDRIHQSMEDVRPAATNTDDIAEELSTNGSRPKSMSGYKHKRAGISIDSADINSRLASASRCGRKVRASANLSLFRPSDQCPVLQHRHD